MTTTIDKSITANGEIIMTEGPTFAIDLGALTPSQAAAWLTPPDTQRKPIPEANPDRGLNEFTVATEKNRRAAEAEKHHTRVKGTIY